MCTLLCLRWLHRLSFPAHNDFGIFYAAGKLTARGQLASAYRQHSLYGIERTFAHNGGMSLPFPFPYPPYVAALFGLLAHPPIQVAYDLWTGVNLVAYVLAALLALRRLDGKFRLLGGLAMASCLPLVISTFQGECSGLLALGLILTLEAFDFPLLMGPAIVLLSMKPQMLLVPVIVMMVRRHRVEMVGAAAGLLFVGAVGMLAGGLQGYLSFLRLALRSTHWTTQFHFWGPRYNYSLVAQLHGLVGYGTLASVIWAALAAALLLPIVMLIRKGQTPWLAISAVILVLAGHVPFHDLTLLYPVAIVALGSRLRWIALSLLIAPWIDPPIYEISGFHMVVLLCFAVPLLVALAYRDTGVARRMYRHLKSLEYIDTWKSFGRPRWGSASGSETQSTL